MSGKSAVPQSRPDEISSSFSESSFSSDIYLRNTVLQTQLEKIQKLEDKLAGYRTVVKQLPKLQATIAELQRKQEVQEKEIAHYRASEAEQQNKILILEKLLQERKQGLADLDTSCRRETLSHSHSSPSFEIISKFPCSTSELFSPMQEVGSSSQIPADETVEHSPRFYHRSIAVSSQQQSYDLPPVARDQPFQSLKNVNTVPANVVGPPKTSVGLCRVLSANVAASEQNFHLSALNQLNSYPAPNEGSAAVLAFVHGNKKSAWQMDPEVNKLEPAETTRQLGVRTSLQARENLANSANSYQAANNTSLAFNSFIQTGAHDVGTRPKEWKPLNIATSQARGYSNGGLIKPSNYGTPQHGDQIPVKTQENAKSEMINVYDTNFSKSDLQKVSAMNINMGEKLPENQHWEQNSGCDDLMTFSSLNTNSPSPVTEQNRITRTSTTNPVYSQQSGLVTVPAEEEPCLTNQVQSMVAILEKSDSPMGMSNMLYKFAEAAKNLESQLSDSKTLIQQQQSRIQQFQRLSEFSQENSKLREEISVLKSENDTLLEFIAAFRGSKSNQAEPTWDTVLGNQNMADPVRAQYPDSPLMKKIESLSNINTRLFTANKDWHSKWEVLRQQTQEEKADLEARVNSLEAMNKNLQENVATLDKELQIRNNSIQDLVKASESVEEEKLALQRLIDELNAQLLSLKTEVKDLTRSKQMLESELASLKDPSRNASQAGNRDYQTEIGLLKQQLTVFAEDFEKEKKDRILAEKKAEKLKKERDQIKASLETRLKRVSVQLRAQEEDLRTKARQNADLLFQVDDLKLKLQREQRKNALATHNSYNYQVPPASYQGPMSMAYNSDMNGHVTNPNMGRSVNHLFVNGSHASAGFSHQSSPEHLPGAWMCKHCTYINYPNRTVCDICGFTSTSGESLGMADSISGRNELQSRGEEKRWRNTGDIVVDTVTE
ncbi:unnamed protein product [Candidula unifasciata]|uniref:RanBP2-type domain-containing protein n=1 Tax=Candidula unifasciata TaxID=100452 RepID=A0A8S3ZWM3_9EUPU|nr:unnamed protein product [Candidula unifasciata]